MRNFFNILTLISAVLLTLSVLLQSRGSGLGASFGGDGNFYRSKRGAEKVIFNGTLLFSVIFVLSIILRLLSGKYVFSYFKFRGQRKWPGRRRDLTLWRIWLRNYFGRDVWGKWRQLAT